MNLKGLMVIASLVIIFMKDGLVNSHMYMHKKIRF